MARPGGRMSVRLTELQVNFPEKRLTVFPILVIMFNSLRDEMSRSECHESGGIKHPNVDAV
jgi:hypothetical protein